MAKAKTIFICTDCGSENPRWLGRCPDCGEYNTLVEHSPPRISTRSTKKRSTAPAALASLADASDSSSSRRSIGVDEFDRVLGGGLVPGSVILLAGDPGVGKSTLLLQSCLTLAEQGEKVLYISAEESAHQVRSRAQRLGDISPSLLISAHTDLPVLEEQILAASPALVVVDSIQAISDTELNSASGTVSQVRQCAANLIRLAKENDIPIFFVGHVTKEGTVAGPRLLEHMVDTVLYLEGERHLGYRMLRGQKNRFGSTDEVGIFEMSENGLAQVADPSQLFLAQYNPDVSGTALGVVIEGSRPLLMEAQGLINRAAAAPRRACSGADFNRTFLILAVLERHIRIPLSNSDVFVNITGGLRISEPAADLAIALSLVSAHKAKPLLPGTICIGEIGLTGEVRQVNRLESRLAEAARLGLRRAVVPVTSNLRNRPKGVEILSVSNLKQAISAAF